MRDRADDLGQAGASRRAYLKMAGLGAAGLGTAALTSAWAAKSPPIETSTALQANRNPGKLSSNENPWGPSPRAIEAMQREIGFVNRYADEKAFEFVQQIAAQEGVDPEQVVIANGSTPILRAFGEHVAAGGSGQVVTSMATYEVIYRTVQQYGGDVVFAPLATDMGYDLEGMASRISPRTTAVYVCNPNNPTGKALDPSVLSAFAIEAAKRAPVFIDEAYLNILKDYPANSQTHLLRSGHNVVICRTFSKLHGLAGQRVGYALASKEIAKKLQHYDKTLGGATQPGLVNHLGMVAAMASSRDQAFIDTSRTRLAAGRSKLIAIARDSGRPIAEGSQTNFIWLDAGMSNLQFADRMEAEGVLVVRRHWPEYENWTRMCVGTDADIERCRAAMKKILKA